MVPDHSTKLASSMEGALMTVRSYFAEGGNNNKSASHSFGLSVEQMLDGIRNSRRRRRVQAQIMTLLADTKSESENSD